MSASGPAAEASGALPSERSEPVSLANPFSVGLVLWRHRALLLRLAQRDVAQRYRGSSFGLFWSFLHPLLMLGVFTFVFGRVLPTRTGQVADTPAFGLTLFAGLLSFWMLSECLSRAPGLVLENTSYVKRIVFPLEVLAGVAVASALFHATITSLVLLVAVLAVQGGLPWTALLLPLLFLPLVLFGLGALWFFSAVGTYVRDLLQVMPVLTMALMFLTPIFYPSEAIPEALRPLLLANPLASMVEHARSVTLAGVEPPWGEVLRNTLFGWGFAWFGLVVFVRAKRGFADVV